MSSLFLKIWNLLSLALVMGILPACGGPLHFVNAQTVATPRPPSFDVTGLTRESVAVLPTVASDESRGVAVFVSLALSAAVEHVSPSIKALSYHETVNKLSQLERIADQTEVVGDLARGGGNRQRMQQIGTALGVRYILQPGFANFTETVDDRFDLVGYHLLKTRISTLRLWLRVWDAQAGEFLWEGAGEMTVATELLNESTSVSLHEVARKLWKQMIEQDLLGGKTGS
ncbi:hypothetical protein [Nitrospira lenta]|uniref:Lipoprotein n=1 Tax=Nitrospira lenta TaxID=1436998 RepID=A0A330LA33_9BACT|nr:hypothetical protein [Nitrospira lenta]SPP66869.1 conserved exported hypothetical protein [Nitrospira lenta]